MSRRPASTGSIFWGLILVAVGGLLLARNFGYSIPLWSALARYWPVLIIAWGVLKLVDYYRFRNTGVYRPLFSGGEVALLIFAIFAGSAMTAAANISPDVGRFFNFPDSFDLWDITGNNFQYSEHHEMAIPSGSSLQIVNLFGFVDIQATDSDQIVLDVQKTVRAEDQSDADRLEKDFTFSISNEGGAYRIASNRDSNSSGRQRYKSNLTIRVPHKISVSIDNRYGRVSLDSVEGTENIVNRYGSVTAHAITGPLRLENAYGSVDVDGVSGNLTVDNGFASTTVRNVDGRLEVQTKYGTVDVQDAKGGGRVDNRYSSISAHRIAGDWTLTGGNNSIDVDGAEGALDVDTSYKTLTVQDVQGAMTLKNRHGGIEVDLDAPPKGNINITGDYSDVSVALPSDSSFSVDGTTRSGQIESEFDALMVSRSGREQTVHGERGQGGPKIAIETHNGRIRIDRHG